MDTYKINIEGLDRELRKFPVNDKLDIAAFFMFGDIEMTEVAARELLKRVPEHDVVVTAEAKGIPLCYEMARQGCRNYVVARKSVKVYMGNPIGVTVNSITTKNEQKLYLGEDDVNLLNGKRVLLVDDVISTGESLHALEIDQIPGRHLGIVLADSIVDAVLFGIPAQQGQTPLCAGKTA